MRLSAAYLILALGLIGCSGAGSGPRPFEIPIPQKVTPPNEEDRARIAKQEARALELLQARYGNISFQHDENDLKLLQRAVDDKLVRSDQTHELQCLGVVLGQVFAQQTPLQWVSVEDQFGRDLALQYPDTTVIVFPLTMISKRVEDGREIDVSAIYRTIAAQVEQMKDDPEYKR
jgi:hypothetical protein